MTHDPWPHGLLDRRVALVTGGSRGIGAATSRELATHGARVAVNFHRDGQSAQRLVEELGPDHFAWRADVTNLKESEGLVSEVLRRHERLDILIVNAGVWLGGQLEELSSSEWQAVIRTSLDGAYNVTRPALPAMRAAGWGRIVVVSSVIGLVGFPGDTAYATAKAGLFGFVRSLAKEVGRDGVTVNAVAPGFIDTDMTKGVSASSRDRMLSRASLRRPGAPGDVAKAIAYLVRDGDYVTGQTLVVDGGFSL